MKRTPSTTFGKRGLPLLVDLSKWSRHPRLNLDGIRGWCQVCRYYLEGECSRILYIYMYVVRGGGYTPPPSKPVSRAGYFNPYSSVGSRASTERRRVPPNYPQCRLLLIELSIPVPCLSQTRILDFRRISMRGALASFAFLRALSREFPLGKYNFETLF